MIRSTRPSRSELLCAAAFALLCLRLLLVPPAAVAAGSEPIQPTDLLEIRQITEVEISPDGRQVAFVVRDVVEEEEGGGEAASGDGDGPTRYAYRSQIHLVPFDGSRPPRQLTRGKESATAPAWSPDGRRLAFVRSDGDSSQVWILPLDGGEARRLTDAPHGAYAPRWSPDGASLVFSSDLPHDEIPRLDGNPASAPPWPAERPGRTHRDVAAWGDEEIEKPQTDPDGSLAEMREWLARNAAEGEPAVLHRVDIQGELELDPHLVYSHLHRAAADPPRGEPTAGEAITRGYASYGPGEWSADAATLYAAGAADPGVHPDRDPDAALWAIALDGSPPRQLARPPSTSVFAPRVSPDGRWLAFLASDTTRRGYSDLVLGVYPLADDAPAGEAPEGEPRLLTVELDRSVNGYRWAADGRALYFTAPSNGGFPLFRVAVDGGPVERLTGYDSGVRAFDVGLAGVAFGKTEVANPFELYALASATAAVTDPAAHEASSRRLTALNAGWLAGKALSHPRAGKLRRPDGFEVDYWVMEPTFREEGKRYPLLLEIHGGPAAMWGPGEATMWHEYQMMAALGFGVVYANPRGSGGYGYDFRHANYRDWGEGPSGDVLAAATEAARLPWVDPARQVVTGGSYAGYLTAWIVGHDHRFAAAVAQRGVYDLPAFLGEGNAWRLVPWHFGGYPWEDEAFAELRSESPLTYVAEITTPLLVLHGDNDLRTGVSQSEILVKSLAILGRPVEYVRYPDTGHDLSRTGDPHLRIDRLLRIYEFFARFIELGGRP